MSGDTLPDDMIEAAAEALCVFQRNVHVRVDDYVPTWATVTDAHREVHRREARVALEAAGVPLLLILANEPREEGAT